MTTAAPSLVGKSAVVTGAARSIGSEAALTLARAGASITVHYRSRKDEAERTVDAIRALGAAVIAVPGDLTDPQRPKTCSNGRPTSSAVSTSSWPTQPRPHR
jgi:NAD(P)-dependent dehydrogenase (short-subunit alcohol dehydrogenase family)